jgi:hypothetical protein
MRDRGTVLPKAGILRRQRSCATVSLQRRTTDRYFVLLVLCRRPQTWRHKYRTGAAATTANARVGAIKGPTLGARSWREIIAGPGPGADRSCRRSGQKPQPPTSSASPRGPCTHPRGDRQEIQTQGATERLPTGQLRSTTGQWQETWLLSRAGMTGN